MSKKRVDFGYQKVSPAEKTKLVGGVFKEVASRYDLMNDFMSFGSHRILKRILLNMSQISPNSRVLDLAGGTGDVTALFASRLAKGGSICLADYSQEMIEVARDRMLNQGFSNIDFAVAQAESLPFRSDHFNCVSISFGFRNFTDKELALQEIYRVLAPGGILVILEFSKPTNRLLETAYKGFQSLWPLAGKLAVGSKSPYQYLIESIDKHPNQQAVKQMLEDANFQSVSFFNFLGGITSIHKGQKTIG